MLDPPGTCDNLVSLKTPKPIVSRYAHHKHAKTKDSTTSSWTPKEHKRHDSWESHSTSSRVQLHGTIPLPQYDQSIAGSAIWFGSESEHPGGLGTPGLRGSPFQYPGTSPQLLLICSNILSAKIISRQLGSMQRQQLTTAPWSTAISVTSQHAPDMCLVAMPASLMYANISISLLCWKLRFCVIVVILAWHCRGIDVLAVRLQAEDWQEMFPTSGERRR